MLPDTHVALQRRRIFTEAERLDARGREERGNGDGTSSFNLLPVAGRAAEAIPVILVVLEPFVKPPHFRTKGTNGPCFTFRFGVYYMRIQQLLPMRRVVIILN
jgi:hypothetical protein